MIRLAFIFAIVFLMVMQAHADPRWQGHSWGHGEAHHWSRPWQGPVYRGDNNAALGGFLGGLAGGWLWRQWAQPEPQVVVVPPPPPAGPSVEWCIQRYRSYDLYTHTYLGFDGLRHGCP